MLRLLLYRRANRILELDGDRFHFVDIYTDETDEITSHTSFSETYKIGLTNGFYFEGIQNDFIMFYVENKVPKIRYEGEVYKLLDKSLKFNCNQLNEKEWFFECISLNNGFRFIYKPYVYDPYDDDDESDVNFGLWLVSILQCPDKLKKIIKAN